MTSTHDRDATEAAASAPQPRPRLRSSRAALKLLTGSALVGLVAAALILPVVGPIAIGARNAADAFESLPDTLPVDSPLPQRATLLDVNGKRFATLYGENRVPVTLADVPQVMIDAVLSTEDDKFYEHGPINLRSTVRAALHNTSNDSTQGASSITQQYVKNILLVNAVTAEQRTEVTSPTLARKLRELRYAVALEQKMSKDEILTGYLNVAYFGSQAYGVGAAAEHYFGKPLRDISLPQAALLAGLLQNPTGYDPTKHPDAATDRRSTVLSRMRATGAITAEEQRSANRADLGLDVTTPKNGCSASKFALYCEYVRQEILSSPEFGATAQAREEFLFRGGFTVRTALNPAATKKAIAAARKALEPTNRVGTAIAVVVPGTGAIPVLATNRPWGLNKAKGQTELVLPALPAYQPGSTFKTFTLATALEQGFNTRATLNSPSPYSPPGLSSPPGGFRNDDRVGHGYINAYQATAGSVNTWYVRLISKTGVLPVANFARRLGISSIPRSGPFAVTSKSASLTLGSYEVSPLEMAGAYATFAANGVHCRPTAILSMTDAVGAPIKTPSPDCHQVISPGVATAVTNVLETVLGPGGTANGLRLSGREAAGKTGTTSNHGGTWFAGYTPQFSTAVWVGDPKGPRNSLLNVKAYGRTYGEVFGATIAAPIWRDVMNGISADLPAEKFAAPDPAVLAGATTRIPSVIGMSRDAAISTLVAQGYDVSVANKNAPPNPLTTPGYVAAQTPEAHTPGTYGQTIRITLTADSDNGVAAPSAEPIPR